MSYRIFVQEADEAILEVLTLVLENEDFIVKGMQGHEADLMESVEGFGPDIVLLDYRLSGDNAKEICQEIKRKYSFLPVLALSCNSNIQSVYKSDGFDGYINKPFDLNFIFIVLKRHIYKIL